MQRLLLATMPLVAGASPARAIDFRFDVALDGTTANNTTWFGSSQLPALNFPSVNGHDIEQTNTNHLAAINTAGNSLGIYYNDFHLRFPTDSAATTVSTVNSYATSRFGSTANQRWLVLNEVDAGIWNGTDGNAYRTWLVDTMSGLKAAGYNNIILWSPRYLASKTYQSTWQSIASYAYIALETYQDGLTIKNNNFSLAKTQAYYQGYFDSWTSTTNGSGLAPSRILAGEHFSVNLYDPTHYWGANGTSGTDWQKSIEIRNIAIHNIPFGGFIGYFWQRNDQATGDDATDLAAQISYERAYASTMVVQTEVPTWTGNDGTTSWADYLNWTGGLPSTTLAPFPLLASTNPTLPKQTTANLLGTIRANTTVTLDGNQSVTHLAVGSSYVYTIAPGTGGSLTLTGSGATLDVKSGSHTISAGLILASNAAANLSGNLTFAGALTNSGVTFTKSGAGSLTINGSQNNSPGAAMVISGGAVNMNSDAGGGAANLAVTITAGATLNLTTTEHLASLTVQTGGNVAVAAGGGKTVVMNSLALTGTGRLNLDDNNAVIRGGVNPATTLALIRQYIINGRNVPVGGVADGKWNGYGIISSSAASHFVTDGLESRAVGYALNSNMPLGALAVFGGQPVSNNDILVRYTINGDTNLDGKVGDADVTVLGAFYDGGTTTGHMWDEGDFNYDGKVGDEDVTIFGAFYDETAAPISPEDLASKYGAEFAAAFEAGQTMVVPEPIGMSVFAIAGALLTRRKRTHSLRRSSTVVTQSRTLRAASLTQSELA